MRNTNNFNHLNKPCGTACCGAAATAPPGAWETQRNRLWRMSKNRTEIYGNQDTRERRSSVLTLNCNSRARRTTGPAQIRQIGEREKCEPLEQGNFQRRGKDVSVAKRNFQRSGRNRSAAKWNFRRASVFCILLTFFSSHIANGRQEFPHLLGKWRFA